MTDIDGGHLEGGGQILRTAVALSAITSEPVRIHNIRKGRDNPGLRPQHLHGIAAAKQICNAQCQGLRMNSTEVTFAPGKISGGTYSIDTKTAGSVTLILQTLIPIVFSADSPVELVVRGGTAVPFSPTVDYFRYVFCSMLRMFGLHLKVEVRHHGFYPRGGGEVLVRTTPSVPEPVRSIDRGDVKQTCVWAVASDHLKSAMVAERMLKAFSDSEQDVKLNCSYAHTNSAGCFLTACTEFDMGVVGISSLGRRGKPAEVVGSEVADGLRKAIECNASVDEWMVDQLIPFMALATYRSGEPSEIKIPSLTKHAQTNIWVAEKFLGVAFEIEEDLLTCVKT